MSSATVPPPGLGSYLKSATAPMHRRVERTPFMAALLRGQVDRPRYAALLRNLQAVYAALEDGLARHAATPGVAPVVMPELFRGEALTADLQTLACQSTPLARSTQQYVQRLHDLSAAKPGLLVAHAYVRYLGDLNGGQQLRRIVGQALGLAGAAGTGFYDFGDAARVAALALRFRAALEDVGARARDANAIVAEAESAFGRHGRLFEQLASAA